MDSTGVGHAGLGFLVTAKPGVGDNVALDDVRLLAGECKDQGRMLSEDTMSLRLDSINLTVIKEIYII